MYECYVPSRNYVMTNLCTNKPRKFVDLLKGILILPTGCGKSFSLVTNAFNNLKQVHACPFREILCCNCSKSSNFAHERPSLQQVRSSMCVYWR